MKRVALISDGWKRLVTYSWMDGIMNGAKEMGVDICLYQFNTYGNWSHDLKHNSGEYSLFFLPNLDFYDGIVFDCTNMTDETRIKEIVSRLKVLDIPVVSISYAVDGFYYVGNNNKKLFREIIDHLYYEHDCRNFVFAGGPETNYENQMRKESFIEAMEEYDLKIPEENFLSGDFDIATGIGYMDEWIYNKSPLPDVFVCANDNIAVGVCSSAISYGYKIPDDFRVTGFDNLDKAAYYNPQITTVEHNRGNIGMTAIKILSNLWDGKEIDKFYYLDSEVIPAESCGCCNNGRVDYRNYLKLQIEFNVKKEQNDEAVLVLENRIEEFTEFDDIFTEFADYIESLKCDGIYIVVDKQLFEADFTCDFQKNSYVLENMVVGYASENRKRIKFNKVNELDRHLDKNGSGSSYMFTAIHFRDEVVGFTILKNPVFLYDNAAFYDIHSAFVSKLENLYKQRKLENANEEMKRIYNRDVLTGLYNRTAYSDMIIPRFAEYNKNNVVCAMVFFDVDHFKEINDTYGHKYGDEILKKIAFCIEKCISTDGYAYRFGGDEFVVFFPYASEEKLSAYVSNVLFEFRKEKLEVSYGVILTDPGSGKELDEYLVMADKRMYDVKSRRKEIKEMGFIRGVDISSLPEHLDGGEKFYNAKGECVDAFELLFENNINSVRLRIWNEPELVPEAKGYCNLEHTLKMAQKIKENGMHFMLDFHYSDYWADPGQQRKPHAWKDLDYDGLKAAVYSYTSMVLEELAKIECLPDIVQIGNEIRSGMLFPDGEVPSYDKLAGLVNAGIRAVRDRSEDIKVMIHLDQGGRYQWLKEWFDAMFDAGMEKIDAIGISYYSFWHGTFMDLKDSMTLLIERYKVPVYVVETAHPWRQCEGEHVSAELMKTAGLPAGEAEQKKSLEMVMQIAAEVSGDLETGVYYWEPLCTPGKHYGSWDENMGMLDAKGKALCSFEAYRDFQKEAPVIKELDKYMNSLYEIEETVQCETGTNFVQNGDFSDGLNGWTITKEPDDITVKVQENEIYFEAIGNFKMELFRELNIEKAGRYKLSVDYRGTNTTGVKILMFAKVMGSNEDEIVSKEIFPSDVRFVNHSMDEFELTMGKVQIGIKIDSPPVFGRIKNISLVEV